jgi:hypothetical protein
MAGCQGQEAWVLVAQPVGPGNTLGVPYTFDLLVTGDLGGSWEDVFQAQGSIVVVRPRVHSPPGGPAQTNQGFSNWLPQSAESPAPGVMWLTSYNEDFGGEAFASTGDAGQVWAQSYLPAQPPRPGGPRPGEPLPSYGWLSTAASSADDAWVLFPGSAPNHGHDTSTLFVTHDGGVTWARATTFSWKS